MPETGRIGILNVDELKQSEKIENELRTKLKENILLTKEQPIKEYWSIVANIKSEIPYGAGGNETKVGTKQFKGGAKVYIVGSYPGMCESLIVIGQHRHTGKVIRSVVRVTVVENLRVKLIYSKAVRKLYDQEAPSGASMVKTKLDAESLEKNIPIWCKL